MQSLPGSLFFKDQIEFLLQTIQRLLYRQAFNKYYLLALLKVSTISVTHN